MTTLPLQFNEPVADASVNLYLARRLVAEVRAAGAILSADGCELVIDAPEGALTEEQWQRLRDHKPDVLALLRAEAEPPAADTSDPAEASGPYAGDDWIEVTSEWEKVAGKCYRALRNAGLSHEEAACELRRRVPAGDVEAARALLDDLRTWPPDPCDVPFREENDHAGLPTKM